MSLIIFLIISAWHFSEDWNKKLDLFKRLVLGMTIVNLPAFFYSSEIYLIFMKIKLNNLADKEGLSFFCPPLNLCTDNAAMVSWAGIEYIINFGINNVDNLDFIPRPRWPLDPKSKPIGRAKHAR